MKLDALAKDYDDYFLSHREVERRVDRVLVAHSRVSLIKDIRDALKPEAIRMRGRLARAYVEEHFPRVYGALANYFGRREC